MRIARFAACQTVRGRAIACSNLMRSVDLEGEPSDLPPEEFSVLLLAEGTFARRLAMAV